MKLDPIEKALRKAVRAVKSGMSMAQAARLNGVGKDRLRCRLVKMGALPKQRESLALRAAELVLTGWFTPTEAAAEVGLASLTGIYRALRGKDWARQQPCHTPVQSAAMIAAIKAMRKGMPKAEAARRFGVLPNSLAWHISPVLTEVK